MTNPIKTIPKGILTCLPALLLASVPLAARAANEASVLKGDNRTIPVLPTHPEKNAKDPKPSKDPKDPKTEIPAPAPGMEAGQAAAYQSDARPFGLDIVGKVMAAGSDASAATFQKDVLPGLTRFLQGSLGERTQVDDSRMALDPSKLFLKNSSDVRVYFMGEGAGYQNTLGFDTTASGSGAIKDGTAKLIFPNASSNVSTYDPNDNPAPTPGAPLTPGDFVNLGRLAGGTLLDFFLIANGAGGGSTVFSTDRSVNSDGINHVVAFAHQAAGSAYLIIGFEDLLGGGDRDFNDVLFAVDIGAANIGSLTSTPEPAMALTLVSFLGLTLRRKRSATFA